MFVDIHYTQVGLLAYRIDGFENAEVARVASRGTRNKDLEQMAAWAMGKAAPALRQRGASRRGRGRAGRGR
eukprot:6618205-Alexandrium_andersonii.AAC.1